MVSSSENQQSDPFATTRWTVVVSAGDDQSKIARAALEELCQAYWYPLFAYVRRRVPEEDARDLTQAFFAWLLEKNTVAAADPSRGRFRAFLLTSLKNFLANEWEKQRAAKRGGGRTQLSLDFESGDSKFYLEPVDDETPEHLFERQWATALLARVLSQLRTEYTATGKQAVFEQLKPLLAGTSEDGNYAVAARELGWTENAARVAAHRLRGKYRELLRSEIAQTVAVAGDVDDEIRWLFAVFSA